MPFEAAFIRVMYIWNNFKLLIDKYRLILSFLIFYFRGRVNFVESLELQRRHNFFNGQLED